MNWEHKRLSVHLFQFRLVYVAYARRTFKQACAEITALNRQRSALSQRWPHTKEPLFHLVFSKHHANKFCPLSKAWSNRAKHSQTFYTNTIRPTSALQKGFSLKQDELKHHVVALLNWVWIQNKKLFYVRINLGQKDMLTLWFPSMHRMLGICESSQKYRTQQSKL